MDFVKPITAAFDVEYAQRSGTPFEEVLNIICKQYTIHILHKMLYDIGYINDIKLNIIRRNNIKKKEIFYDIVP